MGGKGSGCRLTRGCFTKERDKLEIKRKRLVHLLTDGPLSSEDYELEMTPLKKQLASLHERIAFSEESELDLDTALGYPRIVAAERGAQL